MPKRFFLIILVVLLINPYNLSGQYANKQIGLRSGYRSGIFYQVSNDAGNAEIAYHALLSFNNNGIQLTGLRIIYETQISEISPDLWFAWGYGGHAGFLYTDHRSYFGEKYYFSRERFCPVFGVDGWFAVEYRFYEIPLSISLNAKPFVELSVPAFVNVVPGDIGISVAYVF
jgi:hypothetical protein